jgi:PAS domain S-box-containing protein
MSSSPAVQPTLRQIQLGLGVATFLLVLACFSPLFLLSGLEMFSTGFVALLFGISLAVAILMAVLAGSIIGRYQLQSESAQRLIVEQREQLRVTIASIGDAVISTNAQSIITSINAVAETLTGWTSAEALGQPLDAVFRILNEETHQPVESPTEKALREGIIVGLANHTVLVARDGTERPIDDSAAPIRDASGQIIGSIIVFHDITERRLAERRLAISEARKSAILNTSLDAIITMDHHGKVVEFNPAAEQTFGLQRNEVLGRDTSELIIPPQHRESLRNGINQYLTTGESPVLNRRIELTALRADGTEFPVEVAITPIPQGDKPYFTGYLRDITERKLAEQKQREGEERFRKTLMNVSIPTLLHADDDEILLVNAAWTEITGYTIADIPTISEWSKRAYPDRSSTARQFIKGLYDSDSRRDNGEWEITTASGEKRLWHFSSTPVGSEPSGRRLIVSTAIDITDTRQAEHSLSESEQRASFVRLTSGIGFWYCDLPFDVLRWDELVKEHFHLPPDATVTIQTFYDQMHPEDRTPTREAIEYSINQRTPYDVDYRTVHPTTGAIKWIRAIGRTFYDKEGNPRRFDGITLDITERKRLELALRDAERLFRSSLDSLSSHIAVLDSDGVILAVNERWRSFADDNHFQGHGHGVGDNYLLTCEGENVCDDDAIAAARGIREVIQGTREDFSHEYPCHGDNEERWFVMRVTRFVVNEGVRVVVAHENVSARVASELALLHQTEQLRSLAGIASKITLATDVRSVIGVVTEEARALLGAHHAVVILTPREDEPGFATHSLSDKYPDWKNYRVLPDGSNVFALVHRLQLPVRLTHEELEAHPTWSLHLNADDSPPLRGLLVAPITGRDGNNLGLVQLTDKEQGDFTEDDEYMLSQITRLASVAVENARLYEKLVAADRHKNEFLAVLAHELRNPLAPIRNALQVLRNTGLNESVVTRSRDMMERQVVQMVRLIDDLLDISRITRGKMELRREPADLATAVQGAVESSQPLLDSQRHQLLLNLPATPLPLYADVTRLSQVFANLLNNAAKYTEPGGIISLTARHEGTRAVVSVKDNGIGIPPEKLNSIFELFTQVDRSLEKAQGGLGIGLTLVRSLVEMHGGTVEARSAGMKQGSEFIVTLPLVQPPSATTSTPATAQASKARRRVLIVDDNRDAADSMAMMLEVNGHQTRTAYDGLEALAVANDYRPDVILLDIGMPRLNGYDTARQLREQPWAKDVILFALTGWGQEEDRRRSLEAGFNYHLTKPVDPTTLDELL